MKTVVVLIVLVMASVLVAGPVRAQPMEHCPHAPTIQALHACVQHAREHGFIDNAGIARSLHAKLNAAQRAVNRDQPAVAIKRLRAFIHQLDAQTGKHIAAEHAEHVRMHTEIVIEALEE